MSESGSVTPVAHFIFIILIQLKVETDFWFPEPDVEVRDIEIVVFSTDLVVRAFILVFIYSCQRVRTV